MAKTAVKRQSLATIIWSNVVRWQYLAGVSDAQLCAFLGVTPRTLSNYKADPSVLTMRQLQALLDGFGIEPDSLIKS